MIVSTALEDTPSTFDDDDEAGPFPDTETVQSVGRLPQVARRWRAGSDRRMSTRLETGPGLSGLVGVAISWKATSQ
jgi:hypothetical protein